MTWNILLWILVPFIGTSLGSCLVFLMKDKINDTIQKTLLGFAAGVMIAASIFSLILPAMEESKDAWGENFKWVPVLIGFSLGIGFLLLLDVITPHLHLNASEPEGPKKNFKKSTMLVLAVTMHNVPEGMAVGVVLAGLASGNVTMAAALSLSLGIAIQNFPEGAIISMPLKAEGMKKPKACLMGVLSGAVEPVAAILVFYLTQFFTAILPYMLAFAAGAMIYVCVEELIPESQEGKHTNWATIGLAFGFMLMMILDVALS